MTSTVPRPAAADRISTGDEGLDRVLHGGLLQGSVTIVQGSPGAGKTVLANQMAFNYIARGNHALYVTLLAESHARLASHLAEMDFFDPSQLAESIFYVSGYSTLANEGVNAVLELIAREAKTYGATLVILDGLFVLEESVGSEKSFRKFINDLAMLAEMMHCTILLLTNSQRNSSSPEYTMVDAWIEMHRLPVSYRTIRYLEAHKLRGSGFVDGQHTVTISNKGVRILPRLEAVLGDPGKESAYKLKIISTGCNDLNPIVGGGVTQGSVTLLEGPAGIGKTTLGLHFISECTPETPGLIYGFYESPERLIHAARSRGIDLEQLIATGAVEVVWHPPTELVMDALAYELLEHVNARGIKRLLVDGLQAFTQSAVYPERVSRFLAALTNELRSAECTSIFTSETSSLFARHLSTLPNGVSAIADNVLLLRYAERGASLHRTIAAVKLRDTSFDMHTHEFFITDQGFNIGAKFEGTIRTA